MRYQQKDIVVVKFPFTDLSDFKVRPAIIVSNGLVNNTGDYTVVMLTTQPVTGDLVTTISNSDVSENFKPPHTSMFVNCKKIAVLDESIIHKKISKVSNDNKFKIIIDKIKMVFD